MKHESRPHGERPFTYHPQHVDVETFEKNYAAIDWSRKRTNQILVDEANRIGDMAVLGTPCEPTAGWEPIGLSSLSEEVDVAAGWWAYVIHPDDLPKAWKWPGVIVDGYAPRYATRDDALAQENPIFALNEIGGPLNPLWISAPYTVIFTNKLLVGDPLATEHAAPVPNPEYAKATLQERIDVHPMVLAPHCYMCHRTKPALDWIELDEKPRVVCSTRCYHNYCKGSDLV